VWSRRAVDTVDSVAEVNDFNRNLINEFRANKGKVTGPFERAPLLLLTTRGAKSGRERTNPVVYTTDGDRLVIVASKGGAPASPDWYHNLVANPSVMVELPDDERFDAKASVAHGDEHDRLFAAHAALMPAFSEYQQKTTRQIPVVILERV
jgi:deazaflavin-dependent oxidoreductase (nitroreductase family)